MKSTKNWPVAVGAFALIAGLFIPEAYWMRVMAYGIGFMLLGIAWEIRNR